MIDLYKDNHVHACVCACVCEFVNFFFSSETIDWTFTKFHSSVHSIEVNENLLFIVTEKSGLWSDTCAQALIVSFFPHFVF